LRKHLKGAGAFLICCVLLLSIILLSACGSQEPVAEESAITQTETAVDGQSQATEKADDVIPDEPDEGAQSFSGEAPRTDTPLYEGAELVLEKTYKIAVEEVYATDASLEDVIAYYAGFSAFEGLPDTVNSTDGSAYLETEVMNLLMDGEDVGDEIADSGPLMYLMVASSDSTSLTGMIGQSDAEKLPAGKTIICMRILTDY